MADGNPTAGSPLEGERSTPDHSPSKEEKSALDIRKLRAEVQKANSDNRKTELEILELRHWYRRPSFLQPLAAILIASLTAFIGYANGWFSTKVERLKIEQDKLARQIDDLRTGRTQLNVQVTDLKVERDRALKKLAEAASLADQLAPTVKGLKQRAAMTNRYKAKLDTLQKELEQVSIRGQSAAFSYPFLSEDLKKGTGWQ